MSYGLVYKIVNKINNKLYIGQTRSSMVLRFKAHVKDSKRGSNLYFHKAIRKYGEDNFEISFVCEAFSRDELNKLEIYYIDYYKSFSKLVGYNITLGGQGTLGSDCCNKSIVQYDLNGNFIKEWESIKMAAKFLGLDRPSISNCCNGKKFKQVGGFVWKHKMVGFSKKIGIVIEYRGKHEALPVLQYDLGGNFIREFSSANVAAKETTVHINTILANCKGKTRLPKRFIWRYKSDPITTLENVPIYIKREPSEENIKKLKKAVSKVIIQHTLHDTFIAEHESITSAASSVGLHFDTVSRACRGILKTAGGYKWSYKEYKGEDNDIGI